KKPPLEGRFVCAAPIGGGDRRIAESVDESILSDDMVIAQLRNCASNTKCMSAPLNLPAIW
ncbi:hypothetical protein, partial [Pseudomonas gingeri]|uniref:hypothetical protein n=1 Tax=Pseudomonas gingeri TaxID=117681 RepID=UPI001CA4EAE4